MHSHTNKKPLVIWGASGHARVVADIVRLTGNYNIIGFLDSIDLSRKGSNFCGATILGGLEQLEPLRKENVRYIFLGFGDCRARLTLSSVVKQFAFELVTIIHPRAVIAGDATIGSGSVIMAGVVINPGCTILDNAIINTSASIDHDSVISTGAHIGPGVTLGGGVTIGQGTWIGIGAVIKDKIKIGKNTIIGAGAVVLDDIPDGVVAYGVPAKIIRANREE